MIMASGSSIRLVSLAVAFAAVRLLAFAKDAPQVSAAKPSADVVQPASSLPAAQTTNGVLETQPAKPEQRIEVLIVDGKVSVDATNASLNQVLHEIGTKAEIKITGIIPDERVFGHYGPAVPSVVIATLLDGTGSNMLLVDDAKGHSELVLTRRAGGPTPPNPNAIGREASSDEQPESNFVPVRNFQQPGASRGAFQPPPVMGPETLNGSNQQQDSNQAPAEGKTPQQIYEQLQRANQQRPIPQQPQ